MKKLIALTLAFAATGASAAPFQWQGTFQSPSGNQPAQVNTFGTRDFQTTTGTINEQSVNLNTFGSQDYRTTTGTIGGRSVNCQTFGSQGFQTTNCN